MRAIAIALTAVLWVGVPGVAGHGRAAAADAEQRRWEYGKLEVRGTLGVVWTEPKRSVAGKSAAEVYAKLGGTGDADKVTPQSILNLVGADGWELVTATETPGQFAGTVYLMKRPAK